MIYNEFAVFISNACSPFDCEDIGGNVYLRNKRGYKLLKNESWKIRGTSRLLQ